MWQFATRFSGRAIIIDQAFHIKTRIWNLYRITGENLQLRLLLVFLAYKNLWYINDSGPTRTISAHIYWDGKQILQMNSSNRTCFFNSENCIKKLQELLKNKFICFKVCFIYLKNIPIKVREISAKKLLYNIKK